MRTAATGSVCWRPVPPERSAGWASCCIRSLDIDFAPTRRRHRLESVRQRRARRRIPIPATTTAWSTSSPSCNRTRTVPVRTPAHLGPPVRDPGVERRIAVCHAHALDRAIRASSSRSTTTSCRARWEETPACDGSRSDADWDGGPRDGARLRLSRPLRHRSEHSLATQGIGEWGLMGSGNYARPYSPSRYEAWSLMRDGLGRVDTLSSPDEW